MKLQFMKEGDFVLVEQNDFLPYKYMRLYCSNECCWYMVTSEGFLAVKEEKAEELEAAYASQIFKKENIDESTRDA